ncbi:MAG: ABC transporter substrate-binding protein [Gammaproteobacteria bacterium]|nr:ABC transporter substrate-binding protein [Gammaproteobacteria bacterium]
MRGTNSVAIERNPLRQQLKVYGPAALLVVAAFALAYQFIQPAPPSHVVMATGAIDGAYHAFGQRYAAYLAREGITLELRPTAGSVENLKLLRAGEVSLALVQGGIQDEVQEPALVSLGSVYYEPLWLFLRRQHSYPLLRDLVGRRIAVGPEGSGTRALVGRLLRDNGVEDAGNWQALGGQSAADALLAGEVDGAFFVTSAQNPLIGRLLKHPDLMLFDFARAAAYGRRYRFLNHVELPEGVVDLAANVPARTVRLVAPTANLVAHPDLHPAVVDLMLQAADKVHREGGWFEGRDEFPMPSLLAFPLSKEADRFYKHGPPFLQRFLPFWAASLVDRLKVMLLPLLVLLFPLLKVMPPIYTWRMRARVYRWYRELEKAEQQWADGSRDRTEVHGALDRLEAEVQHVNVPLSFTDQLYHLRQHIDLVRRRIDAGSGSR